METLRTFTAFNIFESNNNITVELIKYLDHYEVRETYDEYSYHGRSFTITRKFCSYSKAKCDYENAVHILIDFA